MIAWRKKPQANRGRESRSARIRSAKAQVALSFRRNADSQRLLGSKSYHGACSLVYLSSASPHEESDMTLQVAFVARDGIVIASDKKAIGGFGSSKVRKILVEPKNCIICAFSGDDLSAAMAQRLIDAPPDIFENNHAIELLLNAEIKRAKQIGKPVGQLIIAAVPKNRRLWRIRLFSKSLAMPIEDKAYGGDDKNPAIFWGERYYSQSATVDELKLLAAHIVLEGGKLSRYVGGLDVFTVKDGEAGFLKDVDLESLRAKSQAIARRLAGDLSLDKCADDLWQ